MADSDAAEPSDDAASGPRWGLLGPLFATALAVPMLAVFLVVSIGKTQEQRTVAWALVSRLRARDTAAVTTMTGEPLRSAALRCLAGPCNGGDPVETALHAVLLDQLEFGGTTGAGDGERCYEATARGDAGQHDLRWHLVEQGGHWVVTELSTQGSCNDD